MLLEGGCQPVTVGHLSHSLVAGFHHTDTRQLPDVTCGGHGLAPMGGSAGGALTAAVCNGLAAALALGAAGALIGTRFQATVEALVDPSISKAIIEGHGEDTERSTVLDIARGSRWPSKYRARTLGHPYLDQWRGRKDELGADADAKRAYQNGVARGDLPSPVWASEAIDLINDLPSAAELVGALAAQAEDALARAGTR